MRAFQNESLLKYSLEVTEDLMKYKAGKSYILTDVCESTVDKNQIKVPNEVLESYKFSKYLVDPNKPRPKKVVRVFLFVLRWTSFWKNQ